MLTSELGLSRDQLRTQLANYKEAMYGNSQIELFVNADKLEEDIWMSFLVETNKFVVQTIAQLLVGNVSVIRDVNNMSKVLDAFPAEGRNLVETLSRYLDHPGVNLLDKAAENLNDSAALLISIKSSGLSNAEAVFQRSILEHNDSIMSQWIDLMESNDVELSRNKTGRLGQFLFNMIYQEWIRTSDDG